MLDSGNKIDCITDHDSGNDRDRETTRAYRDIKMDSYSNNFIRYHLAIIIDVITLYMLLISPIVMH